MVSVLSIDGVCYAVRLLKLDESLLCLRHGILMLGTESVLSKTLAPRQRSFRKAIMCLFKTITLWLARFPRFDYIYYLRTRVSSLSLMLAKRLLYVISSTLLFCLACVSLRALTASAFYKRYCKSLCCASVCFIKKIMCKIGLSRLNAVKSAHASVLAILFGACLFVLGIRADKLLKNKCGALKLGASLQFVTEACNKLKFNARTLLFNVWSLRALSLNAINAFSPAWVCIKLWALKCVCWLQSLGARKLCRLRAAFASVVKRITNMLVCRTDIKRVLVDALGGWRILIVSLLNSLRAMSAVDAAKVLLEWCNLLLICCCSVLYCITFYKITTSAARLSFVSAFLSVLAQLRAQLRSLLLSGN